jgi:hypothetical protein
MKRQYDRLCKSLFGIGVVSVCFALLCLAFWFPPADAQLQPTTETSRDIAEPTARIQAFFEALVQANNPSATTSALSTLLRSSPLLGRADSAQKLDDLQKEVDNLKTEYGTLLRAEKIEAKRIGEDIVVFRYILKHEVHPVIWTVTFYRKPTTSTSSISNPNPWVPVGLRYSNDLNQLYGNQYTP